MTTGSSFFLLEQELDNIAADFKKNVDVRDRTFRLKTYKQCFVGSEAVDYLVNSGQAPSREDAVELGRALQSSDVHLFEHVTRDHPFDDDYLFFRFVDPKERGAFKVDEKTGRTVDWSRFVLPAGASANSTDERLQPQFPQPDFDAIANPTDAHVMSRVWPLDEYNTTLLNHVHPPDCK